MGTILLFVATLAIIPLLPAVGRRIKRIDGAVYPLQINQEDVLDAMHMNSAIKSAELFQTIARRKHWKWYHKWALGADSVESVLAKMVTGNLVRRKDHAGPNINGEPTVMTLWYLTDMGKNAAERRIFAKQIIYT